ncbi:MAG: hypothetical protein A2W61_07100 [Deltaproteobacteria bacterium RIFCSPLOWO2_01_44_7]|nr:MAG: hypothetical protein A2712_09965 [Deltaproteobacteria bacterium RIFCSPHIGHO2_01_FULL_43_49]OGQ15436.1 MAG: hypothetical protein A3D22_10495 [Deltaproteobacteria bacterium RIFCSPHIGHO2_02_FULL_44_53]OGQ29629.1 MAG: hypothetical protein A3D98_10695 [Deltaproteobacteria bacterium RIFCSPHIGHO2_12_FULL_44_21]OGQ32242.1 MAG: hypothetical protein A2979_00340 [Deltaproteobacteria bacterium RIFCSPLOWO2_01_FULL_45_74]OGQ40662.1 MAG: hypothetical protein A2W61_07100 [Deltaproteobacteria bacterium 
MGTKEKAHIPSGTDIPIILIEDEAGARETLQDILEEDGYQVQAFEGGKKALQAIAHQTGGLILADILLPDIDGLKVLQLTKEMDPDSAVIMMTGNTSLQMAIDAVNKGAYAYILKPINMEELKVLLKKACREVRLFKENKKLVDSLQLTNRDLEAINRRLVSLNEEMESILHIVSHDLRAPLINIQGFSTKLSGLVEPSKSEELSTCIRFIHKGVEKMDALIQGLLRVARVGHKAYPFQENDLDKIVEDIRAVFDFELKDRSIQFIKPKKFPKIWCRKDEINQVFSNLISNAIHYMGNQPKKTIEVGFEETFDYFKFWVRDTGIGIAKKDMERIFKLFERLEEIPVKGEGLGLALVKKIVQRHDGKVWVESYKGEGSTFYFTLPKKVPSS